MSHLKKMLVVAGVVIVCLMMLLIAYLALLPVSRVEAEYMIGGAPKAQYMIDGSSLAAVDPLSWADHN